MPNLVLFTLTQSKLLKQTIERRFGAHCFSIILVMLLSLLVCVILLLNGIYQYQQLKQEKHQAVYDSLRLQTELSVLHASLRQIEPALSALLTPSTSNPIFSLVLEDIAPAAGAINEGLSTREAKQLAILRLENRIQELDQGQRQLEWQIKVSRDRHDDMRGGFQQLQRLLGRPVQKQYQIGEAQQLMYLAQQRLGFMLQTPSGWPLSEPQVITSPYGMRMHPISNTRKQHKGIDLRCSVGTPLHVTAQGVVIQSVYSDSFGNLVSVSHGNGFVSRYAHLDQRGVRVGDVLNKGDLVGTCGASGAASASHLHYEVRYIGRAMDPKPFINWQLHHFDSLFEQVQTIPWPSLMRLTGQIQPSQQLLGQVAR